MRWLVTASLRFRLVVVAIAAMTVMLACVRLASMPIDVFPEINPPAVQVQTESLGLSALEVEQLITVPLEADLLNGVPWLHTIRSESITGLSSIDLLFEPGTDLMRARQMAQERLSQAHALPNVSKPPTMLQPLSSTNRVLQVGLSSPTLSLIELSVLARWTIAPRLMGVRGVANVAIWGQRERQLQVQVDPKRLRERNVSLLQIIKTTGNALWVSPLTFLESSTPGTGGFIDTPNQRLGLRHISPIASASDLAQVTVEGSKFRLADVASVVEDHQPLIGDAITNGGLGLLLVVEKFPGAHTLEVTRGVENALAALQPGLPGVQIDPSIYRPATYIETAMRHLARAFALGLASMVIICWLCLGSWRSVVIACTVLAVALMATALAINVGGGTLNALAVAGVATALGVMLDDAVGDNTRIDQQLEDGATALAGRIRAAVFAVRTPALAATTISVLIVLPVFSMGGLSGAFLAPLGSAYSLAVLGSTVVSLTLTPALNLLLRAGRSRPRPPSTVSAWIMRAYEVLHGATGSSVRSASIVIAVVVLIGIAVLPRLRPSLLPSFKERDLLIAVEAVPGIARGEMTRVMGRLGTELRTIPGVRSVGAHVGRAVLSDQIVGVNAGEVWVSLDTDADYARTRQAIEDVIDGYPGLDCDLLTNLQSRFKDVLSGTDEDLVVRVYGPAGERLRQTAEVVKRMLARIDGIEDADVEPQIDEPTLAIEVDLAAAQRHGIKPGDVRRAAATLLSGTQVGSLFEEQKVFDVVVWGTPTVRHSPDGIRDLLIDVPGGGHVRLGDVAAVRIEPAPSVIEREAVSRRIDVDVSISRRERGRVISEVKRRMRELTFPLEYHAEILGELAEREVAQRRVGVAGIAAALGVLLLLQAMFRSWRLAGLIALVLPLSLVGGVVMIALSDRSVSLGSLTGLVTVLGLTVRHAVATAWHAQQADPSPADPAAIIAAIRPCVVPIVTSVLAVGVVLLPLALSGGGEGYEILEPMARTVCAGLVTSLLVTLYILPVLYCRYGVGTADDNCRDLDGAALEAARPAERGR